MKLAVLRSCIFLVATYGAESWTMKAEDIKRLRAFEHKCYRKILRIPRIAKRTNQSVRNELSVTENWLLNFVIKQRLKYFGHVKRHEGLEKQLLEGFVAGKRSRERQKKKWTDGIEEVLGLSTSESGIVARDKDAYRATVYATTL